jgi:primosomal protein N' (replication factor Y)
MFYYEVILGGSATPILTYSYPYRIRGFRYVTVPLMRRRERGIIYREVSEESITFPLDKVKAIVEILPFYLPKEYLQSLLFMNRYYFAPFSTLLKFFQPHHLDIPIPKPAKQLKIKLSPEQQDVFETLKSHSVSLLFGDTGSGKTFIYKKYIDDVLQSGGTALFLLPEINLTPQISERVGDAFGDIVDTWHSKRSAKEKREILAKIYNGSTRVIIGTLSALFLPLPKLSLIIVDEEHSDSYSLEESGYFQFNARDMAIYLGNQLKIPVLLGSATPSLNSYYKFPSVRLKGGFFKGEKSYQFQKIDVELSEIILQKIDERLQQKEQTIIFIPIRGNFKYLSCSDCGYEYICPDCSVRLTIYSESNQIKCNRCGYSTTIPISCDSCGSDTLQVGKAGTVQVANELKETFPDANIINFDSDRVKKLSDLKKILKDFKDKKIDILVGTQMIAKGHDYPNVTLSIILGLDFAINLTDFQSYEKTLSLVVQLAGRSGRERDSEIIIGTKYEDFYKKYIDDYEKFLKYEILNRQGLFPPFVNFIRVVIEDLDREIANDTLTHIELYIHFFSKLKIFISGEAPLKKVEKRYRFHLILRVKKLSEAIPFLEEMLRLIPKEMKKRLMVEINPSSYS